MSISGRFRSHKDAVAAGWFSRRHETNAEHRATQDLYAGRRMDKHRLVEEQRARTKARKATAA